MLPLILFAVVATDVAVAILFIAIRRHMRAADAVAFDETVAADMEEMMLDLRVQAEQASAEIGRQRSQLERMLTEVERRPAAASTRTVGAAPAGDAPAMTRREVIQLAGDGLSLRTIAGRTGLSVEEVRLLLAMEDDMMAA